MVTIGWLRGRPAAEPRAAALPKFHTAPCASASQKLSDGMPVDEWMLCADVLAPATDAAPTTEGDDRQRAEARPARGGERAEAEPGQEAASTGGVIRGEHGSGIDPPPGFLKACTGGGRNDLGVSWVWPTGSEDPPGRGGRRSGRALRT